MMENVWQGTRVVLVLALLGVLACVIFSDHAVQGYYVRGTIGLSEPAIYTDIAWSGDYRIIPRENMTMQDMLDWCVRANAELWKEKGVR